jgi:hypothetical protein
MNEPGPAQTDPRPADREDTVEGLRRQINLLLGGLLISSLTLTAFLALQARRASADLRAVQYHVVEQFKVNQHDIASIQMVYGKLAEFGRAHPDFQKRILSQFQFETNAPMVPAAK